MFLASFVPRPTSGSPGKYFGSGSPSPSAGGWAAVAARRGPETLTSRAAESGRWAPGSDAARRSGCGRGHGGDVGRRSARRGFLYRPTPPVPSPNSKVGNRGSAKGRTVGASKKGQWVHLSPGLATTGGSPRTVEDRGLRGTRKPGRSGKTYTLRTLQSHT